MGFPCKNALTGWGSGVSRDYPGIRPGRIRLTVKGPHAPVVSGIDSQRVSRSKYGIGKVSPCEQGDKIS